ncbi:MAG: type II glyceraldehyde-3-phosphate dehydrogenase [Candidatus Omnitrophica bacterium]|nr:type II glyceraldehyde-3-phosphate dehydrogenase [Candidatus Omnitrophota bacterium]
MFRTAKKAAAGIPAVFIISVFIFSFMSPKGHVFAGQDNLRPKPAADRTRKELAEVRKDLAQLDKTFSKNNIKSVDTESIGDFTKELIEPKTGESETVFESAMKKAFGGRTHNGEKYVRLLKNGKAFAVCKENSQLQTLMVLPVDKLTEDNKEEFYANVLEYASLVTSESNKTLEIIMQQGNKMKQVLTGYDTKVTRQDFTMGDISGTKYWWGRHKDFQMEYRAKGMSAESRPSLLTFKKSWKQISGWTSLIVQPKYTVVVNGYGTIGAKAAEALRKSGFYVQVTARSVKPDSIDASEKGFPILLASSPEPKIMAEFKKSGIAIEDTLEKGLEKADMVIDCTPGKIGAQNVKDIYSKFKNLKVVLQGGEKDADGMVSFSSSTNYEAAVNKDFVRVVSCNTTAMARIYGAILDIFSNVIIDNTAMRRAADPSDEKSSLPPDASSLSPSYHHGADLITVLTEMQKRNMTAINTPAGMQPTTHFHFHTGTIRGKGLDLGTIQQILRRQSRVGLVEFDKFEFKTSVLYGIYGSINSVADVTQPYIIACQVTKSDIPGDFKITFAVPQESDVVPENVNAAQAMFGLMNKNAAIRLVDEAMGISEIKAGVERRLPLKSVATESRQGQPRLKTIDDLTDSQVKDGWIVLKVDNNVSNDKGQIKDDERIRRMMPTLLKLKARGAKVIIVSHNNKPKGKVVSAYSMGPVAARAQKIADEMGYAMKFGFIKDSVTEEGLDVRKVKDYLASTTDDFVYLENCRFAKGEQNGEEKLARDYASLNDNGVAINDAFGAWESAGDVTVLKMFKYFKTIAKGDLIGEEYRNLKGYVNSIYGLDFGGGPKLSEKMPMLFNIIPNMKKGGFINLGTGPAPAFLLKKYGIKLANRLPVGSEEYAGKIIQLAEKYGIRLEIPQDFIACDMDVTQKATGENISWIDKGELPAGAHTYVVTLEQLKMGTFEVETAEGLKTLNAKDLFVFEIGPQTKAKFVENALSVPKGLVHFGNGPMGVVEIPEFSVNSFSYIKEGPGEEKGKGIINVAVGADTTLAFKNAGVGNVYFSTGGKAGEGLARGDKLAAERGLEDIQAAADVAQALPIEKLDALELIDLNNAVSEKTGVKSLSSFVKAANALGVDQKIAVVYGADYVQKNGVLGLRNIIKETVKLKGLRVALYGEEAENAKIFFGEKSVVVAPTSKELADKLAGSGIPSANILFVGTKKDIDESAAAFKDSGRISPTGILSLDAATAVTALLNSEASREYLREFNNGLSEETVINTDTAKNIEKAIVSLAKGLEGFTLTAKTTEAVASDTERISSEARNFWDQI